MKPDTNKQIFKCYIKTLSPVHIGCDEVYEPTGFVMNESDRQIVVFNPVDFIGELSSEDRGRFTSICSKGTVSSILEIYKFLRNRSVSGRKVNVCRGFVDHYKKTLSMNLNNEKKIQQELNSFAIPRTSFSPSDQRPYIPGSSVKGSLRTAYTNLMEQKKKLSNSEQKFNRGQDLEKELMDYSRVDDDPFRLVKVSDFMPVGDARTKIVYGVNVKKKISDKTPRGGAFFFEVIEPGACFEGSISVEQPATGAGIREPIDLQALLAGAFAFYSAENKRESKELAVVGITSSVKNNTDETLIRCGRHSGAESVTVDGHRSIRIMGKKGDRPKYSDKATTFWLTSDVKKADNNKSLKPFGWASICELTETSQKDFSVKEQEYKKELDLERQRKIAEAEKRQKIKLEQAEAEKKKAQEVEEKRIAEEKRKAELEAMTPEDREIEGLKDPNISEEKINIIFKKIDEFSQSNQQIAGEVIKKFWQSQHKWVKKDFSSKQWKKWRDKINKIKTILDES